MDENKVYPDPTLEDANRFWQEFAKRHPDIERQLQGKFFLDGGSFGAFQPKTLDDVSYNIFTRYLKRWFFTNGFWHKQVDEVYVSLNNDVDKTVRAIDTDDIISIERVDDITCKMLIKDFGGFTNTLYLKETFEHMNRLVYIF